mmetsp:Transcript_13749/g.39609  ORF Transcript_13749/g.39609 Transcript_13749/m.39609 type:complete len:222 (+) Transcript_13749:379-1044(+)
MVWAWQPRVCVAGPVLAAAIVQWPFVGYAAGSGGAFCSKHIHTEQTDRQTDVPSSTSVRHTHQPSVEAVSGRPSSVRIPSPSASHLSARLCSLPALGDVWPVRVDHSVAERRATAWPSSRGGSVRGLLGHTLDAICSISLHQQAGCLCLSLYLSGDMMLSVYWSMGPAVCVCVGRGECLHETTDGPFLPDTRGSTQMAHRWLWWQANTYGQTNHGSMREAG